MFYGSRIKCTYTKQRPAVAAAAEWGGEADNFLLIFQFSISLQSKHYPRHRRRRRPRWCTILTYPRDYFYMDAATVVLQVGRINDIVEKLH